jgi:Raf kinase inhibitor-like YbhB/YbcL family protein
VKLERVPVKLPQCLLIILILASGADISLLARVRNRNLLFISAQGVPSMAFTISSPSFPNGGNIPRKFTCDGADISPELSWSHPPADAGSFALIADDPDAPAGTWTHWVIFDLPPATSALPEAVSKVDELPSGGRQGRNDFQRIGYGGPCPPAGKPHRYFFKLYALDRALGLKPGSTKQELEQAMQSHILEKTEWMGKYQR